jgi:hypothetical protein
MTGESREKISGAMLTARRRFLMVRSNLTGFNKRRVGSA